MKLTLLPKMRTSKSVVVSCVCENMMIYIKSGLAGDCRNNLKKEKRKREMLTNPMLFPCCVEEVYSKRRVKEHDSTYMTERINTYMETLRNMESRNSL